MKPIKNILVALDLSAIDDTLIKHASYLADQLEDVNVYFVHNIKKYEIYSLFEKQLEEINLEEIISDELNEKVANLFTSKANTEVLISDDPSTESLIEYVVQKYLIDLTIVGNKTNIKGSGVLTSKLLRIIKCDMLSIPEKYDSEFKNVWVGTDFSSHSIRAFRRVQQMQPHFNYDLSAVHAYSIPMQFTPHIRKETMVEEISSHLNKKAKKFLHALNISMKDFQLFRLKDLTTAESLLLNARRQNVDLLAVADHGSNNLSSLLVGSITEDVFNEAEKIAILIVK